uniref:Zinc finger GRF-type domain-containing protein n=1 Tax=Brassica oleracea var. oleracea TaxID=109376 RepID=A0A0D3D7R2_BRAOL
MTPGGFLHLIDDGVSSPRAQMDPAEERRHSKRQNHHINMLGFVADSEYGIPRRCLYGGRLINEVRGKEDYDTLPGKRFFTCKNYELSVQEELERLTKRVEEAEQVMMGVLNLSKQIETLEEEVKILSGQVDYLTVQVDTLEKCYVSVEVEVELELELKYNEN